MNLLSKENISVFLVWKTARHKTVLAKYKNKTQKNKVQNLHLHSAFML
jgi:hypothetical protein